MKFSQKIFSKQRFKGFTLIEILSFIGILVLIFSISIPISLNFYKSYILQSITETILNSLKKARQDAIFGYYDSDFGVYFDNIQKKFIVFKGTSFSSRDQSFDLIYDVPSFIEFSGLSEIVFRKITGAPSQIGEIYISNGRIANALKITSSGKISFFKNVSIGSQ